MRKVIFWNVDTQKDFMNPDGTLYIKGAESIKRNLKELTKLAKEKNIMVINTCDMHFPADEELSENPDFITTFPYHCMYKSEGSEFIKETNPEKPYTILRYALNQSIHLHTRNIIIHKNKFDVFKGNKNTERLVELINPDIVIVYGVATNVCVDCAVVGLIKKGISVFVVEDCIKELPNLELRVIYNNWKAKGVYLIKLEQLKRYIERTSE